MQEKIIDVPTHTHQFISAFSAEGFGTVGLIPWDSQILIGNDGLGAVNKSTGTGDGPYINFIGGGGDDEYFNNDRDGWYLNYKSELQSKTGSTRFEEIWNRILLSNESKSFEDEIKDWAGTFESAPLGGIKTKYLELSAKIWWPSPFDVVDSGDVVSVGAGHLTTRRYPTGTYGGTTGGSATITSAAIDVSSDSFRIEAYTPPLILEDSSDSSTSSHNHLMGLSPVLDPSEDFSYGNQNGAGLFKQGLGGFGSTLNVTFDNNQFVGNTPPVGYVLNTGTFTLNQNIKKPIPSVRMQPNIQVPIVQEFHKVKYIIKAF